MFFSHSKFLIFGCALATLAGCGRCKKQCINNRCTESSCIIIDAADAKSERVSGPIQTVDLSWDSSIDDDTLEQLDK